MTRMTRKHYLTQKARLTKELAATHSRLATLDTQSAGHAVTTKDCDEWNDLYDYADHLETQLKSLEDLWMVRRWTAADFATQRLIHLNID